MEPKRIIPCLDFKDGRVVKGVHFVNLRDVGDAVENALLYEAEGADELTFLDISATTEGRATMVEAARKVAEAISIPFAMLFLRPGVSGTPAAPQRNRLAFAS